MSYGEDVRSVEELIEDLKALTPEQLEQVASMVRGFSQTPSPSTSEAPVPIPQFIVDQAVLHNWPKELFSELIGSLPDIERPAQPPYDVRG